MTNQLIPVFHGTISSETTLICNARNLHEFLEVGKMFARWIKDKMSEYEFVENQDYIIIANSGKKSGRGRPAVDYHLTLDTAKELAMVERNEKGRQIRRYFIECEKRLRQQQLPPAKKPQPCYRYHVVVTIKDTLLGGDITFCGKANTFRHIATGIATDLGYKPSGFTEVPEVLKNLIARQIH